MAAKLKVFANQGNDDIAVAPVDLGIEDIGGCARRVLFGARADAELSERSGYLWWDEQPLIAVDEIALPGAHNVQNAMAAAAVCLARGIEAESVAAGLRTFAGVAHRLEQIAVQDGVAWVNDSKATNVASTIVALQAFERPVLLIAGGRRQAAGLLAAGAACRAAVQGRVPDRRSCRRSGSSAPGHGRAAAPGRRPRARRRACARRGPRGRRGAAVARVRELRSVPQLRGAGRALPRTRGGGLMARAATARSSGAPAAKRSTIRNPRERTPAPPGGAAARAPHPDDRRAVPAGVRRRDGLQRVVAAGRDRRPRLRHRRVRALPGVRSARPGRDARAGAARHGSAQRAHGQDAADRVLLPAGAGDGSRLRRAR